MGKTLNFKWKTNEKEIHLLLIRNENEEECNRDGRKDETRWEDRGEEKMNVSEEMLTKNRVSMQSSEEEDAKEGRTRIKRWRMRGMKAKRNKIRVRNGENVEKQ